MKIGLRWLMMVSIDILAVSNVPMSRNMKDFFVKRLTNYLGYIPSWKHKDLRMSHSLVTKVYID
jgi:hypothetical protein